MHLLYCDESNLEEKSGVFFVYGGVSTEADAALELSREIDALRAKYKVEPDFCLKFNPGPPGLPHSEFNELKQGVLELAETRIGVRVKTLHPLFCSFCNALIPQAQKEEVWGQGKNSQR